ncbi:MAG: TolC family protein, partial [Gemmatimonadota bacterium]|nr:TolC family protein [Gemmatimonadota bacterium]MDE3215208.1 TolC family protein [Gemmatimonadota bacterium]
MNRLLAAGLALLAALPARAQGPITLAGALRRADSLGYANRLARASARGSHAAALAPLKGILPTVQLDAGYLQTTDPIGAFGTVLRQRSATPASFDPHALDFPAATRDYSGDVTVAQPLVNADAWIGRRAAATAARAADADADWTRATTRADVVRAYFGAALAAAQVVALDSAAAAAHAHVRAAQSMERNGLVTRSDVLLASVRANEMDAQLAAAAGNASLARRQLATLLALPGDTADVAARFPDGDALRAETAPDTLDAAAAPRADLRAAAFGAEAATLDARRARAAYLPRLNAFGRYDWHALSRPYAGLPSWTAGLMLSWVPFGGAGVLSDVRRADAQRAAAGTAAQAADAQARLQVAQTRVELAVALRRLALAELSAAQAVEAHRIVTRKYEGGLATVVELLDAAAADARSAVELQAARYGVIAADAARRLALGRDPASLAALDTLPTTTTR